MEDRTALRKVEKQDEERTEYLSDCLCELHCLQQIFEDLDAGAEETLNSDLLLCLVNATQEKVEYYQSKHGFRVPTAEQFCMADFGKFMTLKNGISMPETEKAPEPHQPKGGAVQGQSE